MKMKPCVEHNTFGCHCTWTAEERRQAVNQLGAVAMDAIQHGVTRGHSNNDAMRAAIAKDQASAKDADAFARDFAAAVAQAFRMRPSKPRPKPTSRPLPKPVSFARDAALVRRCNEINAMYKESYSNRRIVYSNEMRSGESTAPGKAIGLDARENPIATANRKFKERHSNPKISHSND